MRPWSCQQCAAVLGHVDHRDGRIVPEPNVGIRSKVGLPLHELTCPSCGKKRTWRGDLERPVSRFEVRGAW